ncbi:MAG: ubiquinol-cytochrome C chaperone family protein [Hyphomicrobiales bacterium]
MAQARQPAFYANAAVPDTVDGRFDMIVLHFCLLILRFNKDGSEDAKKFGQGVFDEMFMDMDHSLREMGVGDLSVGKKIKKMARVFYGRATAYEKAFSGEEDAEANLAEMIRRNFFDGAENGQGAENIARYCVAVAKQLEKQSVGDIRSGKIEFPAAGEFV